MFKNTLVSRYKLIKILGRGAFGKTYLAQDILLPENPLCVVKKLSPTIKDDQLLTIARRLFKTEAESLQKLGEHPQIPRFMGYFEEKNKFYLVQQYIEGHSLSKEMTLGNTWSELKVIELLRDCLNILKFIHAQNVIHRDIKPDNIIRNKKNNQLVLVDFGAVKATSQSKIASTIAIGTQGYMPSEQAMGKPRFNSDIYALGIIAIQALTGLETDYLKEDNKGNIIWENLVKIDPRLAKIIKKMTRYHFTERYSSVAKVLKDLESLETSYNSKNLNIFFGVNSLLDRFKNKAKTPINFREQTIINLPETELPTYKASTVIPKPSPSNFINKFQLHNFQLKLPKNLDKISLATLGLLLLGGMQFASYQKQQRIASVLNVMGTNYEEREYASCLNNARFDAVKIGVPRDKINSFIGKCTLGIAKNEAENGNYSRAIAIATEITDNNSFANEAREEVDKWSQILLDRATETYKKEGQLAKVQPIIDSIPNNSLVKEEGLKLRDKWQEEIAKSEQILADANQAMRAKKWLSAVNEANKVKTVSNSIYWQEKADKIIASAQENRRKELAVAAARKRRIQSHRHHRRRRQIPVEYRPPHYSSYEIPRFSREPIRIYRRRVRTERTTIRRKRRVIKRTCRGYDCER